MKMDRNVNPGGFGKYALVKLRELERCRDPGAFGEVSPEIVAALDLLEKNGILDRGIVGTESEFMVIRLKDCYADKALAAYADAAANDDPEWAQEVRDMLPRAGLRSPWCKRPD